MTQGNEENPGTVQEEEGKKRVPVKLFRKKECPKCGQPISFTFLQCPACGVNLK